MVQSVSGQYYSAHLRFFRQLCTAAKVDKVSQLAQQALAEGHCIVIGLQSTGHPSLAHLFTLPPNTLCLQLHVTVVASNCLWQPGCCTLSSCLAASISQHMTIAHWHELTSETWLSPGVSVMSHAVLQLNFPVGVLCVDLSGDLCQ